MTDKNTAGIDLDTLEARALELHGVRMFSQEHFSLMRQVAMGTMQLIALARRAEPSVAAESDEQYEVIVDRRDLFDFLRGAWREGQQFFGPMTEQERWERATNYATSEIKGWSTMRAALASPAVSQEAAPAQTGDLMTVPCPACVALPGLGCDECDGQGRLIVSRKDMAAVSQKDGAAFCPKDVGVCGRPSYCAECPNTTAATTASASDAECRKTCNICWGEGGDPWPCAREKVKGRAPASAGDVCTNCGTKRPLHDLDCPVAIAGRAPAPSRDAAPLDLTAMGLTKLWQQAQDAATPTMPAQFQFAKLLLAQQGASQAPLTDYEIECLWTKHADTAEAGIRRIAFGRAVERAALARAPRPEREKQDRDILADYHYLLGLRAGWNLSQQRDVEGFNAALVSRQVSLDAAKAEARAPLPAQGGGFTDAQIIAALHANGIDTYPSKYGFDAVQVSATSVPALRKVIEFLAAPAQAQGGTSDGFYVVYGDDDAVDLFAQAMKDKMKACRAKGRGGWHDPDECPSERLQGMLIEHLAKGDPVDVANFAMMLWNRGDRVAAPAQAGDARDGRTKAARDVLAERCRQIEAEGWTPESDDKYEEGELSMAAVCYAMNGDDPASPVPHAWPWDRRWWKPADDRRNLVKAAALILADIERLDRTAMSASQGKTQEAK